MSPAHYLEQLVQQADWVMAVDASSLYNLTLQSRTRTESADLALDKKVDALTESFNQQAKTQIWTATYFANNNVIQICTLFVDNPSCHLKTITKF